MKLKLYVYIILLHAAVLAGCSSLSQTRKRDLNRMADNTLAKIVLENPGLQAELGGSAGYIALERSGSGIPMVGKRGVGVLVDRISEERIYIRVTKLEVDGAWGVGDYNGIMAIKDAELLAVAKKSGLVLENPGTIYIYADGEASASYPVKIIQIVPVESTPAEE